MVSSNKTTFFIVALLALFTLKGVLLALLIPLFQNPDELTHYATVQHWAQERASSLSPEADTLPGSVPHANSPEVSQEIIQAAMVEQFDEVKASPENIQHFSDSSHPSLLSVESIPSQVTAGNISGTISLYYLIASKFEAILGTFDLATRVFSARLIATLFGIGTLIIAYFTARKIGFSTTLSLVFTTLIAFQPMFSLTAAQVNIDSALVFAFSFFLYAGACVLKDGLNTKNVLLALFAALLGIFSKGPGIVLIVMLYPLFVWGAYRVLKLPRKQFLIRLIGATLLLLLLVLFVLPKSYLMDISRYALPSKFDSPLQSISSYLSKTLSTGELRDTVRSYWGHFGWLDHALPDWSLSLIILITVTGFIGTLWYLCSQKHMAYLPERRFLVFFLGMVLSLQIAIRFYDWRVFDYTGQILIGQPGRYFLPNIIAHLLIIITGLGFLLREAIRFYSLIKALTLAIILLQLHAIVNVILPRYYL